MVTTMKIATPSNDRSIMDEYAHLKESHTELFSAANSKTSNNNENLTHEVKGSDLNTFSALDNQMNAAALELDPGALL